MAYYSIYFMPYISSFILHYANFKLTSEIVLNASLYISNNAFTLVLSATSASSSFSMSTNSSSLYSNAMRRFCTCCAMWLMRKCMMDFGMILNWLLHNVEIWGDKTSLCPARCQSSDTGKFKLCLKSICCPFSPTSLHTIVLWCFENTKISE